MVEGYQWSLRKTRDMAEVVVEPYEDERKPILCPFVLLDQTLLQLQYRV